MLLTVFRLCSYSLVFLASVKGCFYKQIHTSKQAKMPKVKFENRVDYPFITLRCLMKFYTRERERETAITSKKGKIMFMIK